MPQARRTARPYVSAPVPSADRRRPPRHTTDLTRAQHPAIRTRGPAVSTDQNHEAAYASAPVAGAGHAALLADALFQVKRVVVGQDRLVERVMVCLLADGHCLIEGFPGLAKTLTVSTTAQAVGGDFARLQFTPDLVPADL